MGSNPISRACSGVAFGPLRALGVAMRNFLLLFIVGATACAGRASTSTLPVHYACGDAEVSRVGDTVTVGGSQDALRPTSLGWRDEDGDHFVTWPVSPTDVQAIEIVLPADPHADAVQRTYDTSKGVSTADWRLTKKQTCTARGGYNDVLARYIKGQNIDELANELKVDREEARRMVRTALSTLQHRYWKDR